VELQIYNKLSILNKNRFAKANLFKRLKLCFSITNYNIIHPGRINIFVNHFKLLFGCKPHNICLFLLNVVHR